MTTLGTEPAADRKLACCIPIQAVEGTLIPRVLLVSSRSMHDAAMSEDIRDVRNLVFPKGGWEEHETVYEAAVREAFEEAGVGGRLDTPHIAVFEYDSEKYSGIQGEDGKICKMNRIVFVYMLHVDVEYEDWPEKDARERYWMDVKEARKRLKHDWMRAALEILVEKNGWS